MGTITVKVISDDSPLNPRTEYDNVGVMACWHRRYNLGDIQPKCEPDEWLAENAPEGSVVLALWLYDHSGITMSCEPFASCWDSGQVGWIVATPDKIQHEWNGDRKAAENYLRSEVATYDHYLTGAVYGYVIEETGDPCECCGATPDPEEIDSCWGFFGDALDAMKDHVDDEYHAALTEAWDNR